MSWTYVAIAGAGLVGSMLGSSAQKSAAAQQAAAADRAAQQQREMFDILNAQQAPYRSAGYSSLNQILGGLSGQQPVFDQQGKVVGTTGGTGFFTSMPGQAEIEAMPGYKFAVQQGMGATRQGMNVGGGGSNVERAAQKFAIDYTMGQALPQYMAQRQSIYNTLASIAGLGQTAQGQTGQMGMQTASNIGQLGVGAASALGAGQIGAAQSYGQGLQGLGNAAFMYNLMNPQGGVSGVGSGGLPMQGSGGGSPYTGPGGP